VSEEHTDNFELSADKKKENFRTTVSPGAVVLIKGAKTAGQVGASLSVSHDTATDEVDVVQSALLGGELSWQATPRLKLTITDSLTRGDDPAFADSLRLRRERRDFTSNTFSLAADYAIRNLTTRGSYSLETFFDEAGGDAITHTLGATAGLRFFETNTVTTGYEHLRSETSDDAEITGHQVTMSLARQLTPFSSAGLTGTYALRDVFRRDAIQDEDFNIWSAAAFTTYRAGRWSLTGTLGYSVLTPEVGGDRSSITTQTALIYHFARATASLSIDRGFSETFTSGENLGVVETQGVTASLSYPFTPSISGTASGFYHENQFTGVAGGPDRGTEESVGGSVSLVIQLRRWLTMGLDYTHIEVGASSRGAEFTENRARLSFTAGF
jgi:hypothetical protein